MSKSRLHISKGQPVLPEKLERAREFRRNPTPDERVLWKALRSNALAGLHFRRQQVIDFYCAAAQMVVELDGPVHATQMAEDAERDRALTSMGIHTMRIVSARVRNELAVVLDEIRAVCQKELTPEPVPIQRRSSGGTMVQIFLIPLSGRERGQG